MTQGGAAMPDVEAPQRTDDLVELHARTRHLSMLHPTAKAAVLAPAR